MFLRPWPGQISLASGGAGHRVPEVSHVVTPCTRDWTPGLGAPPQWTTCRRLLWCRWEARLQASTWTPPCAPFLWISVGIPSL